MVTLTFAHKDGTSVEAALLLAGKRSRPRPRREQRVTRCRTTEKTRQKLGKKKQRKIIAEREKKKKDEVHNQKAEPKRCAGREKKLHNRKTTGRTANKIE